MRKEFRLCSKRNSRRTTPEAGHCEAHRISASTGEFHMAEVRGASLNAQPPLASLPRGAQRDSLPEPAARPCSHCARSDALHRCRLVRRQGGLGVGSCESNSDRGRTGMAITISLLGSQRDLSREDRFT